MTSRPGVRQRSRPQQPGTPITRRAGLTLPLAGRAGAAPLDDLIERARLDRAQVREAA